MAIAAGVSPLRGWSEALVSMRCVLLQVQIGADPRNTLFVKCVEYKAEAQVLTAVVAGTLAAACLLVIVTLLVYCLTRRRSVLFLVTHY